MTTSAIFLKSPSGLCIETDDDVRSLLMAADLPDEFLEVTRTRDGAQVIIPIENIADVIIGGHR